jgi:DNA modification methylase
MIKVINEDCLKYLKNYKDNLFQCTVTSPPYNAGKEYETNILTEKEFWDFTTEWINLVYNVTEDGGKLFINTGWFSGSRENRFFLPNKYIEIAEKSGFKFKSWINWVKGSLEAPQTKGSGWGDIYGTSPSFLNGDEPILYFMKNSCKHKDNKHDDWIKLIRTPWVMPCSKNKNHPATFTLQLPENCIKMTTLENDWVLDLFAGSGTTGFACKNLNRNCLLIEKEKKYFDLIKI